MEKSSPRAQLPGELSGSGEQGSELPNPPGLWGLPARDPLSWVRPPVLHKPFLIHL